MKKADWWYDIMIRRPALGKPVPVHLPTAVIVNDLAYLTGGNDGPGSGRSQSARSGDNFKD
jgi:hypothetical protein